MTGAQLARAIADLCSTKPDLDVKLTATLAKWLKDALGKASTLEDFRRAAANGRADVISVYLTTLSPSDVVKLAKKFDPHAAGLRPQSHDAQRDHVLALIRRQSEPAQKPSTRQPPMPIEDVLALTDPIRRRAELTKHTPVQLKKAIKDKHIEGGHLGSKPSKTEMIEHIQAALAGGWPKPHSVLDESKY